MLGAIRISLLAGTSVIACLIAFASPVQAQGESRSIVLRGVKCIMDGVRSCDTQYWRDYQGGKVYFSSHENAERFQQTINDPIFDPPANLLMRANHQLALTGQVKQVACPITGQPVDHRNKLRLAGVAVYFADSQSLQSIEANEGMIPRVKRVFHPHVFGSAFAPLKPKPKAPAEQLIDLPQLKFSTLVAGRNETRCQR